MVEKKQTGIGRILGEAKASKKLLVFAGVAVTAAVGYSYLFAPEPEKVENSRLRTVPTGVTTANGSAQINPAYEDVIRQADRQRIAAAKQQGQSAMPQIIGVNTGEQLPDKLDIDNVKKDPPITLPPAKDEVVRPTVPVKDPEPIKLPDPPKPNRQPPQGAAAKPQGRPAPPFDAARVASMQRMMESLIKDADRRYGPAQTVWLYQPQQTAASGVPGPTARASDLSAVLPVSATLSGSAQADTKKSKIDVPLAGTILYAELVGRANSDAPGPVLAKILQGPYAGATVIGTFQTAQDALVINFTQMTVLKTVDGKEINETIPIKAVAVDTQYIGTAMATDVDHHIWERIAIGFTTSFLSGLGQAISQSGSTHVTYGDGTTVSSLEMLNTRDKLLVAGGAAAQTTGQILNQTYGNRRTTVIVDAGTPIGLLFL